MNEMQKTIQEHGIDRTAELIAEYINQKIPSEDVAVQFILEELEAASGGNESAKIFAKTSGFDEDDYLGAMKNSFEEVDGPDGPQQEILNLCMMLYPDQRLMAELRIKTVDLLMKHWELGKYASIDEELHLVDVAEKGENHEWGVFADIMNDLGEYSKEHGSYDQQNNILRFMAYAYARRTAAAGLFLQGYWSREYYDHASNFFKSAQLSTGQSVEFQENAAKQSMEFLLSYDQRLNKNLVGQITAVVEHNIAQSAYEMGMHFTDEQLFEIFSREAE